MLNKYQYELGTFKCDDIFIWLSTTLGIIYNSFIFIPTYYTSYTATKVHKCVYKLYFESLCVSSINYNI